MNTLDAAGIADPALRSAYTQCRRLNARHGRTFYLATLLLPPAKRPYVHALYGFARLADDIVDSTTSADRADRLASVCRHPVGLALQDTLRRWDIPVGYVDDFLTSMRMDLTVNSYATYADLLGYMHGSAVVLGWQMLAVLEPVVPRDVAAPYAADLGVAFQLTNFLRDVGEDIRRGRVYLPQEDLDLFGVDREQIRHAVVDGSFRRLMAFEVARARETYRSAVVGIRLLHPTSRTCVATAARLYEAILDEIEAADYRVLDRRVTVGPLRRARVAVPGWGRAVSSRRDR